MITLFDHEMNRCIRQDRLREAEQERLIRSAVERKKFRTSQLEQRVMVWVGERLVHIGEALISRTPVLDGS